MFGFDTTPISDSS